MTAVKVEPPTADTADLNFKILKIGSSVSKKHLCHTPRRPPFTIHRPPNKMKYGFIIDNRKCIGCHACTTACKSEHEVPVGVFRTYVKQVEKGNFPDTRRLFSVLRCNHCTDAPCVEICPVEALFIRPDGIVDFDKDRCIGCKSCMQACPYDALYIDPDSGTAAKCNYCAHRVDVGLEPACVVVCPEHAIISGDMHDPNSEIAQTLAREQTTVRKPEKGTVPNLFYIEGDEFSLSPNAAHRPEETMWSGQSRGVGHFAKHTERMAWQGENLVNELLQKSGNAIEMPSNGDFSPQRSIEVLTGQNAKRVYNAPDKGILWGWEVPAYITAKAVSAGAFLLPVLQLLFKKGDAFSNVGNLFTGLIISFLALVLTTALLVKDLDRAGRFIYVLLRPQWRSWLVRGGYALTIFGGLLTFIGAAMLLGWSVVMPFALGLASLAAVVVAVYTAYLFAQARGRDFWQSPLLPLHMLVHAFAAGAAVFLIFENFGWAKTSGFATTILLVSLVANLLILLFELTTPHPTADARATVQMILKGKFKTQFWGMVVVCSNLFPIAALLFFPENQMIALACGLLVILGIYQTERIWVEAPQRIPLA